MDVTSSKKSFRDQFCARLPALGKGLLFSGLALSWTSYTPLLSIPSLVVAGAYLLTASSLKVASKVPGVKNVGSMGTHTIGGIGTDTAKLAFYPLLEAAKNVKNAFKAFRGVANTEATIPDLKEFIPHSPNKFM
jgi:hypothetical protein